MGFFSKLHEITKWVDPITHYSLDATHKSSTTLVGETSHAIGNVFGDTWLGNAGKHWDEMADKDKADFNRWATNTALTAGAVYGGMSAAGAAGSGAGAAGAGAGEAAAGGTAAGGAAGAAGGGAAAGGATGGAVAGAGAGAAGTSAAAAGGGGYASLIGAGVGAAASLYSSKMQQDAARDALNAQLGVTAQARADSAPWRLAGADAVGLMSAGIQPGGYFSHQFDANDLNTNLAPNYAFMLDQGQRANQNAAGVGGGLVGGNALQGLNKWTQDYAQNAYQQAFSNYTANQTNIFNRLSSIAGLGQTANQAQGALASNNMTTANNYLTSGAAAGAAGVVGAANNVNNGISNYLGWQYLNNKPGG